MKIKEKVYCKNCKHVIHNPMLPMTLRPPVCGIGVVPAETPVDGSNAYEPQYLYEKVTSRNKNNDCSDFSPTVTYRIIRFFKK